MAIKCVVIIQQVTLFEPGVPVNPITSPSIGYASRQHLGGWSEQVYFQTDNVNDCIQALKTGFAGNPGLLPSRASCLNSGAQIVGVKLYAGGAGKGSTLAVAYPGNAIFPSDIPQMALLCKAGAMGSTAVRRWTLRGIPDGLVSDGEFSPGAVFPVFLSNYFAALGSFAFRAIDSTLSKKIAIQKITAAGNVKTVGLTNPFALPSTVKISRVVDGNGNLRSLTSSISLPSATGYQFLVDDWQASGIGDASKGVAIQNVMGVFPFNVPTISAARITTRRVGRPFEQYRGRKSKVRKTA